MSKDWDSYLCEIDGKPASVFVDMGIAEDVPIERLPLAAWVQVAMLRAGEDGLADAAEVARLEVVEAALKVGLVSKGSAYVGRIASGGRCDFHFYVVAAKGWKEQVSQVLSKFPDCRFQCGLRPDREWDIYLERLSPSDENLERLRNRRICDSLQQSGDRLDSERPIEHCAYFPDADARAAFVLRASALGFRVVETIEPEERGDQFGVRVSALGIPSHRNIDALTLPLYHAASECGGEYEGWETRIEGCNAA
ncbi:MAG: DUF695 domain-containing protein [Xanthomonadales bacterium]|nr:DUF695 domain-containing protein [Xanthomonadales bacterium]